MGKKVLMLGWGYPPNIEGGLDIHVKNLFQELKSKGVDVDLVLPEEYAPDEKDVIGVETESEAMLPRSREISGRFAELAKDYDIVHTHDWFGSEAGLKSRKYSGTKWVATMHSLSTQRSRRTNEDCLKLEKASAEKSDSLVAVSNNLADEVEKEFGRRPQVIHNGFSSKEAQGRNVKSELGIENKMIFFVGRHAEQKGLEHLLYGFKKFLESEEATLVLGGEGHLTDSLKKFAEILGIEEEVIFTGFIPDSELGDYYREADVFVSPSLSEPFGLAITEALEHGTPVVAADSGVSEILPEGMIIQVSPDSGEISEGIRKALDRDIEEVKGRSWSSVAEETIDLYSNLS